MEFKGQVESAIRMTRARVGLIGDGTCLKTIWVVRWDRIYPAKRSQ